ncbi:hypothetical protein MJO28_016467 [Puccinia striiformis f. sp. tritici]|uniref:4'-phosphopantetheinyl transferase domain-containing protein n=2 Tax=Puccinia striiformis f. sp. tritici TaxID=168172 RepID=A0A0L0VYV3_9BASI|nr:hypothetical protein Pst134EA_030421 [Puccinia striiformis f. sp. tritici]KAH9446504.1 hypothetical protein Pst134EA_030421 [Puccinia striiformis f. sp. tritici]KAI7935596.1 hypothetical protein MJO28_016467 [Puccinia striiformis f. sp. tritici]KAI9600476.1 hypothetical protein H4Q26_000259 [Puccinia striiformis f. sp. tritici PST-130]KNF04392.1 hypothetical protein PSTG_02309 [Puccinia striiformis f. sp. tritici PST-78]
MQHIIGIGIDLLDRRRLSRILMKSEETRARLTRRILSGRERMSSEWTALAEVDSDSTALVSFLANRWTAKEAAYKALYPFHTPTWKQLSLLKHSKKPCLLFHPSDADVDTDSDQPDPHPHISLLVSISHDGPFTIASVLASSDQLPE